MEEINHLFKVIENDKTKSEEIKALMIVVIKILFFEGLRIGELMGIKFKDFELDILNKNIIDEKEITLNLKRTVYYTTGGWILSDGKTKDSLGRLFIGSNVVNYLIKYIRLIQRNGIVFNKNDYVFTNPNTKKLYSQEGLRAYLNYFFDLANMKRRTFHQLRHSCGTFMLSIGYRLEDVKDKLRHSSIRTTERYYVTFYESVKRERAREIDKYA